MVILYAFDTNYNYYVYIYLLSITPHFVKFVIADDQGPELPTRSNEEFRPFIRRLPEFKFWYAISKSTVIGITCTFFEVFNIPVFWPILVMYFITLFCITMKRQIKVSTHFILLSNRIHLLSNRLISQYPSMVNYGYR